VGGAGSITNNAALSSRVQTLLPSGESVTNAAAGFEDQGQFIAAAHAAHNLNIPFDQLKAQMTGKDQSSLGKAIQKLRPDLDGKDAKENEADRANLLAGLCEEGPRRSQHRL
jgi:hypothetical protein